MKTISERIKEGLHIRGMKQAELVEKTGIGKSSISTYISGAYEPKQRNIYKIAKALDVNESWLMGYDVPMDRKPKTVTELFTGNGELKYISPEEAVIIRKYNSLDDKGKHTVNAILEMEYNRCNKPYLVPNAAHAADDVSEEEIKHDDNLMNDNDIWN